MTETNLAAALWALMGLGGLFALYLAFRDLRSDDLRDRLFTIRDEMFLYAYDHGLVDTAAYRNLRVLLNSLIRYAHKVSFARLLMLAAAPRVFGLRSSPPAEMLEWRESVESLSAPHREKLKEFHTATLLTLWWHLVSGSPLLMSAYILIRVAAPKKPKGHRTEGLRECLPAMDNFETEALRTARAA